MKHLLTCIVFLFINNAMSQLDSASIFSIENEILYWADSSSSDSVEYRNVTVELDLSDVDYLGEVIATIYESETQYPLTQMHWTKAQLDSSQLINYSLNRVVVSIPVFDTNVGLNVRMLVRNYQGANLPYLFYEINN